MRRILMLLIGFSLLFLMASCHASILKPANSVTEREQPVFEEWEISKTFVPENIQVVGLGDSLTQGVGDELKVGGYFTRLTTAIEDWKGVKGVEANNLAKRGRRSDQLIKQLEDPEIQNVVQNADVIFLTIGGNDLMKIVKRDLLDLKESSFYKELNNYEQRLDEIFGMVRGLNSDAVIVVGGLYNPLSIVTDDVDEFENIINDWNEAIEVRAVVDGKSCFVPLTDLFNSNENMVYHTDFFHPNAKGYEQMANRYIESIDKCGLLELSDGKLDM